MSEKPHFWNGVIQTLYSQMALGRERAQGSMTLINIMRRRYIGIPWKTSTNLIAAVARLWDFTSKMEQMDWSTQESLADATVLYHKFLMLMTDHPGSMLVPILSIDLAWHTHMLSHCRYREYTLKTLNRVINHDDTITSGDIHKNLILTANKWYEKYKEPYTTDNLEDLYFNQHKLAFFFPPTSIYYIIQQRNLRKAWLRPPKVYPSSNLE